MSSNLILVSMIEIISNSFENYVNPNLDSMRCKAISFLYLFKINICGVISTRDQYSLGLSKILVDVKCSTSPIGRGIWFKPSSVLVRIQGGIQKSLWCNWITLQNTTLGIWVRVLLSLQINLWCNGSIQDFDS